VDDPLAFIDGIDIVVLPSLWEGMPNVLLEAMAASRPIVASRLGGIEEMLRDGESALLCDPGCPGALADAIMRLMDDPDLGRRLAGAARRDVEQRFGIARTVAATQALYDRLALRRTGEGKHI
jgi:glycosyltransferase involved in cell wall biosynthesis